MNLKCVFLLLVAKSSDLNVAVGEYESGVRVRAWSVSAWVRVIVRV